MESGQNHGSLAGAARAERARERQPPRLRQSRCRSTGESYADISVTGLHRFIANFLAAHEGAYFAGQAFESFFDSRLHINFHEEVDPATQVKPEVHGPMYLGLDLRGGVHFLMEVDMESAIEKTLERLAGEIRTFMRGEKIRYKAVQASNRNVSIRFASAPAPRLSKTRRLPFASTLGSCCARQRPMVLARLHWSCLSRNRQSLGYSACARSASTRVGAGRGTE